MLRFQAVLRLISAVSGVRPSRRPVVACGISMNLGWENLDTRVSVAGGVDAFNQHIIKGLYHEFAAQY
jgi:hypothetical protein